jgi:hydrogenase expression/formation protein HypE
MTSDKVLLDHGSGGKLSHSLTAEIMLAAFDNPVLAELADGAVFSFGERRLAFSTDSYVVDPIFFPGGNIGDLAVNGTVNDLAMCGAVPAYLSVGFILEEGFPISDLKRVVRSMREAAAAADVQVVTGDTKVVPRGAADKIFINTAGIGRVPKGVRLGPDRIRPGDRVLLSGTMADHGITIMAGRGGMGFTTALQSDTAPLHSLVSRMMGASGGVRVLRDPTRGGVGTALNEIAEPAKLGIRIDEDRLPVRGEVSGMCELLGFDPLYLANEGKLLAVVAASEAERILEAVRSDPLGAEACLIGEVVEQHPGRVFMRTRIGGTRIVDMLSGEQLPRIC